MPPYLFIAHRRGNLPLADSDETDVHLFRKVLNELSLTAPFMVGQDSKPLMRWLTRLTERLPGSLFLDLKKTKKGGAECWVDLKNNPLLKHLSGVLCCTFFDSAVDDRRNKNGVIVGQ